jgi:arsenate reductase
VGNSEAEKRQAFESTRQAIGERMRQLAQTHFDNLTDEQLQKTLQSLTLQNL